MSFTKGDVWPLHDIIDAPINSIQVDVEITTPRRRNANVRCRPSAELIPGILHVGPIVPLISIVRFHPKNQRIEFICREISEKGVAQFGVAIGSLEEEPERFLFREVKATKCATLNPYATINLEVHAPIGTGRIDQFQRSRPFPVNPAAEWVGINSIGSKKILLRH